MGDAVNQPDHYKSGGMEAIDVIESFFHGNYFRGNVFKYIVRAGKKSAATELEDLQKARVYLEREIDRVIRRGADQAKRDGIMINPPYGPLNPNWLPNPLAHDLQKINNAVNYKMGRGA